MIKAKLYFERIVNPGLLLETLRTLPEAIRPVYFAEGEGKVIKTNRLDDETRFRDFLKTNSAGFLLSYLGHPTLQLSKLLRY